MKFKILKASFILPFVCLAFMHQDAYAGWNKLKCFTQCTKKKCGDIKFGKLCMENCSPGTIKNCKKSYEAALSRLEPAQAKPVTGGPLMVEKPPVAPPPKDTSQHEKVKRELSKRVDSCQKTIEEYRQRGDISKLRVGLERRCRMRQIQLEMISSQEVGSPLEQRLAKEFRIK